MKRTVNAVTIVICFVFASIHAGAQVSDAGLWASVNIEKKFTQKFSIGLTEEFRFNENISELGSFFTDVGAMYKFGPDGLIRTSLNYRFANRKRVDDSYSMRHRYYTDITLRKKFGDIIPMYRMRLQSQYTDVLTSEDGNEAEYYIRNRFMLKYSPDKQYKPYVAAELFTRLRSDQRSESDNVRYSFGVDYELNEKNAISLGYLIEREFNKPNPERNYVITVTYGLSL